MCCNIGILSEAKNVTESNEGNFKSMKKYNSIRNSEGNNQGNYKNDAYCIS